MYDENLPEPVTTPDTPNQTKFYYHEMKGEGYRLDGSESIYRFYQRLMLYNTGRWHGKWTRDEDFQRNIENLAIYDAIASQLDLTKHQKRRGRQLFKRLNLKKYSNLGGVYIAAFCVCALICSLDGRAYYPTRKPENNDSEFVNCAESVGFRGGYIQKAIERVRSELDPYL